MTTPVGMKPSKGSATVRRCCGLNGRHYFIPNFKLMTDVIEVETTSRSCGSDLPCASTVGQISSRAPASSSRR